MTNRDLKEIKLRTRPGLAMLSVAFLPFIAYGLLHGILDRFNGSEYLAGSPLVGLLLVGWTCLSVYAAVRGYPILHIQEDRVELDSFIGRKYWEWRRTGRFRLSPPVSLTANGAHLVAMFPGDAKEFENLTGRAEPDFTEADIVIPLAGYSVIREPEAAIAFLDQVNQFRANYLAKAPLDFSYCGVDADAAPAFLAKSLRRKQLIRYAIMAGGLVLLGDAIARLFQLY